MRLAAVLALIAFAAAPSSAGPLSDFEKAATTPAPAPARAQDSDSNGPSIQIVSYSSPAGSSAAGDAGANVFTAAFTGLVYGGAVSAARATGNGASESGVTPRRPGDALIPNARVESAYQWVRGGVSAVETRAEVGWAWAALEADYTSYWDRKSNETLSTTVVGPLYRMSFGDWFEADVGYGAYSLSGAKNHAGTSFTLPLKIEPSPYWGVEFRPSWHSLEGATIRDHEAALRLGGRWASLRGGYRWVDSGGATLDGPFVGAMLVW